MGQGEGKKGRRERWRCLCAGVEEEEAHSLPRTHHFFGKGQPSGRGRFLLDLQMSAFVSLVLWQYLLSFPSAHLSFPSRKKNTLLGGRERKVYLWEGDQRGRRERKLVSS